MFSNKVIIRCVVFLSTLILSSSSPLLRSSSIISNVNIAESSSTRILQSDGQPPNSSSSSTSSSSNGSDSGSTLVIVGAVGAVLSILILIGGMCYAKRKYSDSSTSRGGNGREYELNNMISSMEKNAAKKDGKGSGLFKRGSSKGAASGTSPSKISNHNNSRGVDAANDNDAGYESDIPPPPPQQFGGRNPRDMLLEFYQTHNPTKVNEIDKVLEIYAGNEELMFQTLAEKYNVDPSIFGLANKQAPSSNAPQDDNSYNDDQTSFDEEGGQHHTTTADDDMSFAYSVDQSSIFGFNKSNNTANPRIDPYIGGAAMQSFQNEKGGVFEWNEDGTKMVYTPAMGDAEKQAQNGFVYDERKKKWVVSKQAVGSKGVSFKATTSANDGKSSTIMMAPESPKRTHSDASSAISGRSDGTGMTGLTGLTGLGSEFTFGAVGNDYSTVRTRSGTTFVSTGIAIPGAEPTEGVEVEGASASDIDRIMLADSEDLSEDYSDGGGNSESGHVAGTYDDDDDDDEPGMIIPKRTVRYPTSNTIEEDAPYDDEPGMIKPRRSKPVPNFENRTRQLPKRNRKPSFGRRV